MLSLKKVSKSFSEKPVLQDITIDIQNGEFVFVVGASGVGKTTLIKLILKEIEPDSGEIVIDSENLSEISDNKVHILRQQIGCVFQDFKLLPERTVFENIATALAVCNVDETLWDEKIAEVLEEVGLSKKKNSFPSQLSGGEIQRASLARALVVDPKIIIADEPTGNLDWETAEQIMNLFIKINEKGKTVIVATHHKALVESMKKRVIELKDGKLIADISDKSRNKSEKNSKDQESKKTK